MSERKNILIPTEEITRQAEFLQQVRELNVGVLKKYSISTFGCQMNENDSEKLAGMLAEMGYVESEKVEDSDVILYNTCCVRENAELKVYGHLGSLKKLKEENPDIIIAICGCMMQQQQVVDQIKRKYRHVDLIFGTHNIYKFPELLYSAISSKKSIVDIWESAGIITENMPIERKDGLKAWVTIMYGCNNFCSYCIVPYVRGRERSRKVDDIVNEIRTLGQQGYKEITLLGQNVNSYGKDLDESFSFAKLLYEINKVHGIERIRFMTSHPKDLSDELVIAMKECDMVCEHLHLPIQSGSTKVLKEMNRNYSKEQYMELAKKIKSQIPDISLTTDIIIGFPGETEDDFLETLDVVERVGFDSAYTFLYSKRTGTPAAENSDQITEEVKKDRFERLIAVQNRISKEINDDLVGKSVEVLVEGLSKNNTEMYTGRTSTNKIVNFRGNEDIVGKQVIVKIEKSHTWSLEGRVI
jgi:tRNA-2-methylthio-N6-dimethylallyladenosine synthase